jgi:hypothetical protein
MMHFTIGFFLGIFVTLMWEPKIKEWLENRKVPYSWSCMECTDGNKFTCRANDVRALDHMVVEHKGIHHE